MPEERTEEHGGRRSWKRRELLRAGTLAVAGAGIGGSLTACGAAFNPATADWLSQLALSVASTEIPKVAEGGLKKLAAWSGWSDNVKKSVRSALTPDWSWYGTLGYGMEGPPVVLVGLRQAEEPDPGTDKLLACVNAGKQRVLFEPWAWQGLSLFVHDMVAKKKGADLVQAQTLCAMSLMPSGVVKGGRSPAGTVGWMSYETRNGIVEIARVAEPHGAFAVVKAGGILDENRVPVVKRFSLPSTTEV